MGRPAKTKNFKYTDEVGQYVLSAMESNKNLIELCREYNAKLKPGEPTLKPDTIHNWKRTQKGFKEQYELAYDSRLQYLGEYIMDLAHQDVPNTGDHKRDNLELTRRKLIIDSLKFTMAVLNGAKYKQHVQLEHTNAPTITIQSYTAQLTDQQSNSLINHIKDQ